MEFKRLDRGSALQPLLPGEVLPQTKLDWPIFDADGTLIAERGQMLPSREDRDFLFIHFEPHRTKTDSDAALALDGPAGTTAATAPETENGTPADFSLQTGHVLRIKTPKGIKEAHALSRVIGQTSNQTTFVSPPIIDGKPLRLLAGEEIQIMAFSGKSIFEFRCTVESVAMTPFEYLILSKPFDVRRVKLRRSVRVSTRIACWLAVGERFQGAYDMLGAIRDISVMGASLSARGRVAEAGARLHLRFSVRTQDYDIEIRTPAIVRNVTVSADDPSLCVYGLEFEALAPVEHLALQCFVNEHSINTSSR
ncbi:flagellar brake protein [Pararobbsia silviterrae]|uniref:Flagellar brake protein n=1 Tax=Pararobbsia silviterrae TaxID=1792498 RepID=A0A494YEK0_9BURK|nr:flagellar brake protein [Pararobbsia silviterrae]RKP59148.1 flagellar brake protein [Pararobbsia silviterrae]